MTRIALALLVSLTAWATGCQAPPAAPAAPSAEAVTLSEVTAARTDLMFRYQAEAGQWAQATRIDEIPAAARAAVVVVDLARSPAERAAGQVAQVFDLRTPDATGRYPGRLVPRDTLEQALSAQLAEQLKARQQTALTMYSASWCGVCRKARAFMDKAGIAYIEKDIEKDPTAARELADKAQAAGVQTNGVPVFDVGGRIISGFDPQTLQRLTRGG